MRLSGGNPAAPEGVLRLQYPIRVLSSEVREYASKLIARIRPEAVAAFMAPTYDVNYITTRSAAQEYADSLRGDTRPYGFDFETTGWSPSMKRKTMSGEIKTVSSFSPSQPDVPLTPACFQLWSASGPVVVVAGEFLPLFFRWLRDEASIDGANLPFEQKVIRRAGGRLPRVYRDVVHLDYLLEETTRQWRHGLKEVVRDRLGLDPLEYPGGDFADHLRKSPEIALEYASFDAWDCTFACDVLQALLMEQPSRDGYDSLWDFYVHCERTYGQVVAHIDDAGMPILPEVTQAHDARLSHEISAVDARCYREIGRPVNLSSDKELAVYFYQEKAYPVCVTTDGFDCLICNKKVTARTDNKCKLHGRGALINTPALDAVALAGINKEGIEYLKKEMAGLEDEDEEGDDAELSTDGSESFQDSFTRVMDACPGDRVVAGLVVRRALAKQSNSYVVPFFTRSSDIPPEASHLYPWAADCPNTRVMHPSLNATDVISGRLKAPLALTIPVKYKDQVGFPKGSGWGFECVDEGQVELRVLAEITRDPTLVDAIQHGRDLHAWTGALVEAYLAHGAKALDDAALRLSVYTDMKTATELAKEMLTDYMKHLIKRRKHGKCFHPDTEVLTKRGWVRILELNPSEELVQAWPVNGGQVELEWAVPLEVMKLAHDSGKLVNIDGETVSMSLTPDHRTLVQRGGAFKVVTPAEVLKTDIIPSSGTLDSATWTLTDQQRAELRVAIAVQADGSYEEAGSIDIRFLKPRKIERFRQICAAAGVQYRFFPRGGDGKVRFSIPPAYARRVKSYLDTGKRLDWRLINLDRESRLVLLDEIVHWDSSVEDGGFRYSTKHKQCADVVQAVAASVGMRTRVSQDREWYRTRVSEPARTPHPMNKIKRAEIDFRQEVACLSVPSSYVLVRLNGTTFVSGQSINFALIYGQGDDALALKLGSTVDEARKVRAAIMAMYSTVAAWMETLLIKLRQNPTMITLGGRHRTILGLNSEDGGERSKGERDAINQSCQCGARDLIMAAMIQVDLDIEAGGGYGTVGRGAYGSWVDGKYVPDFDRLPKAWRTALPTKLQEDFGLLGRVGARVVDQVHDELLVARPDAYSNEVRERVVAFMEDPWGEDLKLSVPLKADGTSGRTWRECKGAG